MRIELTKHSVGSRRHYHYTKPACSNNSIINLITQHIIEINTHMVNTLHTKYKYLLECSCMICKRQITAQSLPNHLISHVRSNIIKTHCLHCDSPIYENGKKFCNRSCSASHNNKNKVRSQESKNKISEIMKKRALSTPSVAYIITNCEQCNKEFTKKRHTKVKLCSPQCIKIHNSNKMKEKIKNGYNPNKHRGRHKRSYMETSFETWLNNKFPSIVYVTEHPFKSTNLNKTFFTDFYFDDLKLAIELDGTQHEKTKDYDKSRDASILSEHGVYVYRISHQEYKSGIKIPEVETILSMSNMIIDNIHLLSH